MFAWATRTFLRKLTSAVCLLVLLTGVLVGLVAMRVARNHMTDQLADQMEAEARLLLADLPRRALSRSDANILEGWARRQGERTGIRVSVISLEGKVLGDSEVPLEALPSVEDHSGRPEIRQALGKGRGSAVRLSRTIGIDLLYVAVPIESGAEDIGTLRLAMPLEEVRTRLLRLRTAIALATLICLLAAIPLSILVSRSIHFPLGRLAETADRISKGDFSARAEVRSKDELGRLSEVMNSMAEKTAQMISQLRGEKAQLEGTLDNMVEAVALVDAQGRILELNHVMERLFDVRAQDLRGRPFLEAFRHNGMWELIDSALQARETRQREIELFTPDDRLFECAANPILSGGAAEGAVLVLHDITRLRRLEEVRKEFVGNVSHELRTPLAHIKGSAETLRRGAIDDKKNRMEFVENIESQADRMSQLVDDLLDLAEIESDKRELRREKLDLGPFVEEAAKSLSAAARRKGVEIESRVAAGTAVLADRTAVRQILTNLLDNAIKYNRDEGRIEISARESEDRIEVSVSDTGAGIPAKDLPRIFERFYRVDKARSRELGGTGLGLSIVKHLVESQDGRVWAESSEGKGSVLRFTLPAS